MSRHTTFSRAKGAIKAFPKMLDIAPKQNYQANISHSHKELSSETWKLTAKQMQNAYISAGKRLLNVECSK